MPRKSMPRAGAPSTKKGRRRSHDQRDIAVVGPGAVGGTVAASLRSAGFPVVLIARDARAAAPLRRGLTVTGPRGRSRRLRSWSRVGTRLKPNDRCAAVFLCVKAPALPGAIEAVRPGIGPETVIVSLLNGLDHVRPLRAAFRPESLVFGSCFLGALRSSPARIRHWGGDLISIANNPRNSSAAGTAASLLRQAGWKAPVVPGEERLLWTKLAGNAAVNPLGALLRRTNGELAGHPASRELMLRSLREAAAVAKAAGFHIPAGRAAERRFLEGCRALPKQYNSMVQDLDAGRKTEIGHILGPVIREGRRSKIPTPMAEALLRMVRRLEEELR